MIAASETWTAWQLIDWLIAHPVTRVLDQLVWFKEGITVTLQVIIQGDTSGTDQVFREQIMRV